MKDRLNRQVDEYRLLDKWGGIHYMTGRLSEVADYALRNQLLIDREPDFDLERISKNGEEK